jgi:putative transposase
VWLALSQISRAATEGRFSVMAYCFMPDHLHLLVQGQSESADGREFAIRAKQYSGYYYQRQFGRKLWQRYSYERTLRADEDTLVVARYILENPVRAKVAETVLAYPFVGSLVCELKDLIESAAVGRRGRCD